jgi:arylsulfatase A-like enzyme
VLPALSGDTVVPEGTPMLAGWLAEAGFQTALRSSNLWLSAAQGNTQGYADAVLLDGAPTASEALDSARQAALALAERRPWLVHVHLMEPHAPYDPPAEYLDGLDDLEPIAWDLTQGPGHYRAGGEWPDLSPEEQALLEAHMRIRYAGELAWLDDQLSAGLAAFEADGLLDDTLLVIWSDHGEAFFEHGFQGHARDVYAEETRALAIFSGPGLQPLAWQEPTHATDLVPTLLRLYGQEVPEVVTGHTLGEAPVDRARFAHVLARNGGGSAVESAGWSLHFDWETGARGLFDTRADPGEAVDLYAADHPELPRLWELLQPVVEGAEALDDEVEISWP